jgi:hypothetical protein
MYTLSRNKWIITSAVIGIISLSIFIIIIFFYYNNNNQNLYRPATTGVDKFGIREIYPTKSGGEEWFMNMQDPTSDLRFDPQAIITKNPDGSYKVTKEEIRFEVYPSTGYHQDQITTLNQKELAAKGICSHQMTERM